MSIDLTVPYTLTAPTGVDGFGEIAVLNDTTSGNFVGYLEEFSPAREIRENADEIAGGDGGIHGSFYSGRLPFTLNIRLERASTFALSNARADKLFAALLAMSSDGSMVWTESGRVATRLLYRQQSSPRGPDENGIVQVGLVSACPLILANSASSSAPGSGLSNAGKAATFPSLAFTSGASGSVVISRTSPSPTQTLTLTIGGTSGLAASTATTIDFAPWSRSILQGTTDKRSALVFPTSTWWAMAPGANTISVSGASGVTVTWRSAWMP